VPSDEEELSSALEGASLSQFPTVPKTPATALAVAEVFVPITLLRVHVRGCTAALDGAIFEVE
jgi:hypothetical protein